MARGSFNFFELHAEKFALGAAGAFFLAMVWLYGVNTPNLVDLEGQKVSSRELDDKIDEAAKRLDQRINSATAETTPIPAYSKDLDRDQRSGILAAAAADKDVPVPPNIRLASNFGKPLVVAGLEEDTEAAGQISLVRPLAPTKPVVITGRSVAARKPLTLGGDKSAAPAGDKGRADEKPAEFAWVSLACYFDKEAQRNEMTNAHYANFRTKVYVAGVDVQRQEVLSSGDFSDWLDVKPSKAALDIGVPNPVIDDGSGQMLNKGEITQVFNQVQQAQHQIIQPPFYSVEVGSEWDVPPLEGFNADAEGGESSLAGGSAKDARLEELLKKLREDRRKHKAEQRKAASGGGAPPPSASPRGGGGLAGGGRGGFSEGAMAPSGPRGGGGGSNPKADARRQAQDALKGARTAMAAKEYSKARDLVNGILGNLDIEGGVLTQAARLFVDAEKHLEKEAGKSGGGLAGGMTGEGGFAGEGGARGRAGLGGEGPIGEGGARGRAGLGGEGPTGEGGPLGVRGGGLAGGGGRGFAPAASPAQSLELVTHPDKPTMPAVWFHDDAVEAGKTYRYRMRVKLWNRYVGFARPLRDAKGAAQTLLVGDWSQPSDPISVTPSTYFFLNSAKPDKSGARVDVFKWNNGDWVKRSFEVAVGDAIGATVKMKTDKKDEKDKPVYEEIDFSTGAVVLDLRFDEQVDIRMPAGKSEFNYRTKPQLVMAYLEPADGQVKERVLEMDKFDPVKKKLDEE